MHCYFANKQEQQYLFFDQDDEHHLIHVLRIKVANQLEVIYQNQRYLTKVVMLRPNLKVEIIAPIIEKHELPVKITMLMPLLKLDKNEWALQKATELGVTKIVPVILTNAIIKFKTNDQGWWLKKIMRWNKIVKAAAQQANRDLIPKIVNIITNLNDITQYCSKINLIANDAIKNQTKSHLKEYLCSNPKSITFITGPEGGFTKAEIHFLENMGFKSISLGRRILRAETAPIVLLANIGYHYQA